MSRKQAWVAGLGLMAAGVAALALAGVADAADTPGPGMPAPRFAEGGKLAFPEGYREWQFVTAGHGMNYTEAASGNADPPFDNVFVQREAYAAFKATGHWPEGTMLILEIRGGTSKGSINKGGAFQHGIPMGVEVHVRDAQFKGGWGFFAFSGKAGETDTAAMIPYDARCYACHQAHGAVDTTFVQFYPTLLPVATDKGTLSEAYLKAEAALKAKE